MNRSLNIFKTTISGLVLAACSLFYSNTYAQWCTGDDYTCWGTAMARQQNEDIVNRGRNNGSGSAPVYVPTKPSKYGAVAWDNKAGVYGYSVGQPSKRLAKLEAIKDCNSAGCKVVSNFANTCTAAAFGHKPSGGYYNIQGDVNKSVAEKMALSACNAEARNCEIIMSECSLP